MVANNVELATSTLGKLYLGDRRSQQYGSINPLLIKKYYEPTRTKNIFSNLERKPNNSFQKTFLQLSLIYHEPGKFSLVKTLH